MTLYNKKAKFNYEILEKLEVGLVLLGPEVKSIQAGKCSFENAFAVIRKGEVWLMNFHINQYEMTTFNPPDPIRKRKLLLHKHEIRKLEERMKREEHLTLIPLSIYRTKKKFKCELALCKGKKNYDKRETLKKKEFQKSLKKYKT